MVGIPYLNIGTAGHRRIRIYQINRVEELTTIIALVSARFLIAAIGARTFNITIRQKAAIGVRVHLLRDTFFDEAIVFKHMGEMLR